MVENTVLVTGANGQLGQKVQQVFAHNTNFNIVCTDVEQVDITSRKSVEDILEKIKPNVLINCSAYTDVDKAETQRDTALKVNHKGSLVIADKCKKHNVFLIHISTDYVFSGEGFKPYPEEHPTRPVNFYGETKELGEEAIMQNLSEAIIIRTAWLYSEFGKNFVKTMLRLGKERKKLGVIDDQVGSPTYAGDLANAILLFVQGYFSGKQFRRGLYHYTNEGVCSWYDFALKIQQFAGNDVEITPIPTTDYPTPAKRPFYSVLSKQKIKEQLRIEIPHWEKSLMQCLKNLNALKE